MHALYGACDPRWRSWFDAPEWVIGCYAAMRPRIEAERELAMFGALLAAGNRALEDQSQSEYLDRLRRTAEGDHDPGRVRPRVKPTRSFLAEMQAAAKRAGGG